MLNKSTSLWKKKLRPQLIERCNASCEHPGCKWKENTKVWSIKNGENWNYAITTDIDEAFEIAKSVDPKAKRQQYFDETIIRQSHIHLFFLEEYDMDKDNYDIDRIRAVCQLHRKISI